MSPLADFATAVPSHPVLNTMDTYINWAGMALAVVSCACGAAVWWAQRRQHDDLLPQIDVPPPPKPASFALDGPTTSRLQLEARDYLHNADASLAAAQGHMVMLAARQDLDPAQREAFGRAAHLEIDHAVSFLSSARATLELLGECTTVEWAYLVEWPYLESFPRAAKREASPNVAAVPAAEPDGYMSLLLRLEPHLRELRGTVTLVRAQLHPLLEATRANPAAHARTCSPRLGGRESGAELAGLPQSACAAAR